MQIVPVGVVSDMMDIGYLLVVEIEAGLHTLEIFEPLCVAAAATLD